LQKLDSEVPRVCGGNRGFPEKEIFEWNFEK
jgi:hypothetical protein